MTHPGGGEGGVGGDGVRRARSISGRAVRPAEESVAALVRLLRENNDVTNVNYACLLYTSSARYQRLVRDAEGGLHTVAAADGANHVSPLGGGEGFTTGSGFVASGLGDSYLYLAKSDGVYVLDEKGCERLLICYEDCMINPKKLLGFEALSEGRFLCSGPGGQYILRPASPDEIGQKTELTLAIFADTPYILSLIHI